MVATLSIRFSEGFAEAVLGACLGDRFRRFHSLLSSPNSVSTGPVTLQARLPVRTSYEAERSSAGLLSPFGTASRRLSWPQPLRVDSASLKVALFTLLAVLIAFGRGLLQSSSREISKNKSRAGRMPLEKNQVLKRPLFGERLRIYV